MSQHVALMLTQKTDIYKLIDDIAIKGVSVLMISSEMPELIGMCDRIYVMRGRYCFIRNY